MKPALTAEEWEEWIQYGDLSPVIEQHGELSHHMAALCLHSQPFGFTRKDVILLLEITEDDWLPRCTIEDLASRIEALLPPEEKK